MPSAKDYCLSLHSFVFKPLNLQGLTVNQCNVHLHKTVSDSARERSLQHFAVSSVKFWNHILKLHGEISSLIFSKCDLRAFSSIQDPIVSQFKREEVSHVKTFNNFWKNKPKMHFLLFSLGFCFEELNYNCRRCFETGFSGQSWTSLSVISDKSFFCLNNKFQLFKTRCVHYADRDMFLKTHCCLIS